MNSFIDQYPIHYFIVGDYEKYNHFCKILSSYYKNYYDNSEIHNLDNEMVFKLYGDVKYSRLSDLNFNVIIQNINSPITKIIASIELQRKKDTEISNFVMRDSSIVVKIDLINFNILVLKSRYYNDSYIESIFKSIIKNYIRYVKIIKIYE